MIAAAWRPPRSPSSIAPPTPASSRPVPSPQNASCSAFSSMCCRGGLSRCATTASLVRAFASAWSSCSSFWGLQERSNHPLRRQLHQCRISCVPNAESRCVFCAAWLPSCAARHENQDLPPLHSTGLPGISPAVQFAAPGQPNGGRSRLAFRRYFLYNDTVIGRMDVLSVF